MRIGFIFFTLLLANAQITHAAALPIGAGLISEVEIQALRSYEPTAFENGAVYTKSASLNAWVQDRNTEARTYLDHQPIKAQIEQRATELASVSAPAPFNTPVGDFYLKQGSLVFAAAGGLSEKILVDKSTLAGATITDFKVSPDSGKVAYATALGGSDSNYWSVLEVTSLKMLTLKPIRVRIYALGWALDSKGLYYSKWPALEVEFNLVKNNVERAGGVDVAYHRIGDDPTHDVIVFKNELKSTNFSVDEIPGTRMLVAHRTKLGFAHQLTMFVGVPRADGSFKWTDIVRSHRHVGRFVTATSQDVIAVSSEPGNHYGLVAYSIRNPMKRRTLVPASNEVLAQAQRVGDLIVAQYFSSNFEYSLRFFDLQGKELDRISLAGFAAGTQKLSGRGALPASVNGGIQSRSISFVYSALETPPITLSYDFSTRAVSVLPNAKTPDFNGNLIESRIMNFKSFDGTEVPLQVYSKKGAGVPKFYYLYFYGSNGVVNASTYNIKFQNMLELGGAVALVGVRGGGEKGADWYKLGMKNRLASAADVAWAARSLKSLHAGNVPVVAAGRSYGGMLTNVVMTHFSSDIDIFVPIVGVTDTDYYLTDYHGSIGWDDLGFGRDRHGQIVDSKSTRRKLRSWSPARNVNKMTTLGGAILFTAESDERTGPHQTYLMTELLRRKFPTRPVLMVESKGGHASRVEATDEATFIATFLGIQKLEPLR